MEDEQLIDFWSDQLAKRLIEVRYVDVDVMKASIKVNFKNALFDCLKIQLSNTNEQLIAAKARYNMASGNNTGKIMAEIISLKKKLKQQNKLYGTMENDKKHGEIYKWMRKHHEQSLIEFYKYFDTLCYRQKTEQDAN
jgi:hypothetical protein